MKNYPTPEQLYALVQAARRARNAEMARLANRGVRMVKDAIARVAASWRAKGVRHA